MMCKDWYAFMLKKAKMILTRYLITEIEANDLVADTYLKHGELQSELFIKKMLLEAGVSKNNRYKRNENKVLQDRVCKACGAVLPTGFFRSWFLRGYLIFDSYCIKCRNEYNKNYKRKAREIDKYKYR